jgi:MFS family permease
MTDSPFWVAFAPALRGLMQIVLGTFSGVLLDRFNRRHLLILAEIGNSLAALCIGILVITSRIELWHILVSSVVQGIFISIRWPAINTMLYEIVHADRVLNASATQILGLNLGIVIASSITGILIDHFGIGIGYMFGTACGLIGVVCIWLMRGKFRPSEETKDSFKRTLQRGWEYIWTSRSLRWVIMLGSTVYLLGWSHDSILTVLARDVLGIDATGLGFLFTAGGIGAFIATFLIAGLGDYQNKIRLILVCAAMSAIMLVLIALSPWYSLSLIIKAILQGSIMGFEATLAAVILLLTSDHMRGRVQGFYTLTYGFSWLGGVILGSIASISGAPLAIGLGGIAVGLTTISLWKPIQRIVIPKVPGEVQHSA